MNSRIVEDFSMVDMSDLRMPMITVYEKPVDFPNSYIARLWDLDRPTNIVVVADTLEKLREVKPHHMTVMPAKKDDDPVIVETWF